MTLTNATNLVQDIRKIGQSIWIDYMRRGLIKSGELKKLIDTVVSGVTSNPTIFEKAIAGSTDYDEAMAKLALAGKNALEIYEALAIEDIRAAADLLRPVFDRTGGADGYASLECNPVLAYDTDATMAEARRLFAALDRPNVMVKVAATPQGIPAIRQLINEGVNVNVTLIFSLEVYAQVREAYISGLEQRAKAGQGISQVTSVASFFLSRVDTSVDALLSELVVRGKEYAGVLRGKAALANAKLAYQSFTQTFGSKRFSILRRKRARVQRPLWASTGTKNPAYPDLMYVEPLIGPDTINTMTPATINAFLDHARVALTLTEGVEDAKRTLEELAAAGVEMDKVTARLLADGVKSFSADFGKLLAAVEVKKAQFAGGTRRFPGVGLAANLPDLTVSFKELEQKEVVARVWRRDHTLWKQKPAEITDRLGWLTVIDVMVAQAQTLKNFTAEACRAAVRYVVLLGMGGSSLGPEVLRRVFGSAPGFPRLTVLDSTVPESVWSIAKVLDAAHTLFLVSSKSGTTIETISLYKYFRELVDKSTGEKKAGHSGHRFVAITDPDTPLAGLAAHTGFSRCFLNPTDIGGRYSVFSYFGLVPAAFLGLDMPGLLDRAERMHESCASCVPLTENPGAWLGAVMGTMANQGRDKLTLICSPLISSLGLWLEQLLAESTGKEGKGIVPIVEEPLVDPECYGSDRLFVYLRLDGDNNSATDTAMEAIKTSSQPLVTLALKDLYDLGGEFFRWEFATVVAGAVLGVNPFDQPNVQQAKAMTGEILKEYQANKVLRWPEKSASLEELLALARPGDYLAILVYANQTREIDGALAELRRKILEKHHIATMTGYGPRYLHSTGQLHKGGPNKGLFLIITTDHDPDPPVPGEPYTFGVLADAEALGDLKALQAAGRRVSRINLETAVDGSIHKLLSRLMT